MPLEPFGETQTFQPSLKQALIKFLIHHPEQIPMFLGTAATLHPVLSNYVYTKISQHSDDIPIPSYWAGFVASVIMDSAIAGWLSWKVGLKYYEHAIKKNFSQFKGGKGGLVPQRPSYHLSPEEIPVLKQKTYNTDTLQTRKRNVRNTFDRFRDWVHKVVADHPYASAFLLTSPTWVPLFRDAMVSAASAYRAYTGGVQPLVNYYLGEFVEKGGDTLVKTTLGGLLLEYVTIKTRFRNRKAFYEWGRYTFRYTLARKKNKGFLFQDSNISEETLVSLVPEEVLIHMERGKIKEGLQFLTWYYSRVPYLAFSNPDLLKQRKRVLTFSTISYAKEYKRHPDDYRLELLLLTYAGLYGYQDNYEAAWHFGQKLMKAPLDEEARMALLAHNAQLAALRSEEHLPEDSRQALLEWHRHVAARPGSQRERYTGTSAKVYYLDDPSSAVPAADNILLKKYRTLEEAVAERDLTTAAIRAVQGRPNLTLQRILDVVPEEEGALSLIATEHGKTLYDLIRMQGFLPEALLTDTLDYLVLLHERIPLEASKKGEWHLGRRVLDKLRAGGAALGAEERALFESLFHPQVDEYEQLRQRSLAVFPKAVGKDAHLLNWMLTSRGQICAIDFEDKGVLPAVYDLVNFIDYHRLDPPSKNLLLNHAFGHYAERRPGLARADFDRSYDFGKAHRNLELTLLWTEPESPGASDQPNRARIYREGLEAAIQLREESAGRQAEREYRHRLVRAYEAVHILVPEV